MIDPEEIEETVLFVTVVFISFIAVVVVFLVKINQNLVKLRMLIKEMLSAVKYEKDKS